MSNPCMFCIFTWRVLAITWVLVTSAVWGQECRDLETGQCFAVNNPTAC